MEVLEVVTLRNVVDGSTVCVMQVSLVRVVALFMRVMRDPALYAW